MALAAAHTKAADVILDLDLRQEEFDWDGRNDNDTLTGRVAKAINKARITVVQIVGTANYSSTDDVTLETVKTVEHELACAEMMRQRAVILSSRPEEAPPPEYIDVGLLVELARARRSEALMMLAPYQTSDTAEAIPGLGFSFGGTGIDETYADQTSGDYDAGDYDDLPS